VTIDHGVERIQFAYPQIYYACHTRHERKKSTIDQLSMRDSEILVHLDRHVPMRLTDLARHMDLSASTLSEAVKHLVTYGYVDKLASEPGDRRAIGLKLSLKGVASVRATSVLEATRIETVLRRMPPVDRAKAIDGLTLLANACRRK
jgi:DNA-binding MarR family transcriptional regulator